MLARSLFLPLLTRGIQADKRSERERERPPLPLLPPEKLPRRDSRDTPHSTPVVRFASHQSSI